MYNKVIRILLIAVIVSKNKKQNKTKTNNKTTPSILHVTLDANVL